ncbi:alpha/beta family hydrolase [Alloalcanivorax xenomutans]|uniref:alpha/beta family hydrolase n=1 Tax=Alloalcanivorax xenomutans TaxID=1094342 RepID=UPI002934B4E0|nr:alpha/beta family hydrolase [Alloalcanivorax xenomutans]WOD26942.1 alpha/beta family hydrolase [Alloalcanivorax xenomutans]
MSLLWNRPERPKATLVLAHGAGAPMDSPFMTGMAELLAERGIQVARFEFDYMDRRRREGVKAPPDRAGKLLARFDAVVGEVLKENSAGLPLWIGGKSMGGRMATLLAADTGAVEQPWAGVVALGYPFHPPGKPERTRTEHLPLLSRPTLICQGERDPFGKPPEVAGYALGNRVTVTWLPDGDHDLKPRKSAPVSHQDNLREAADRIVEFIDAH